ncbi:MAG: hypothetical protein DMG00_30115 [Acidobacteria bacterium]|nr:MAG: hypothetical protein DMG00_30115 [Acidobacteriota bacterium]
MFVQVLQGMRTRDPSYLLRIDTATGRTVWRVERPTPARFESPDAYTTPALLRYGNSTEIVITGGDVVTGHDPATGKDPYAPRRSLAGALCAPNMRLVMITIVVLAGARAAPRAENWPQWRGPSLNEVARPLVVRFRPRRADAGHRRHLSLRDQRSRHHVVPRC